MVVLRVLESDYLPVAEKVKHDDVAEVDDLEDEKTLRADTLLCFDTEVSM